MCSSRAGIQLCLKVTTLWLNRIAGDEAPGAARKYAWVDYRPFDAKQPRLESALLGPAPIRD
jgi:hypothetical protein